MGILPALRGHFGYNFHGEGQFLGLNRVVYGQRNVAESPHKDISTRLCVCFHSCFLSGSLLTMNLILGGRELDNIRQVLSSGLEKLFDSITILIGFSQRGTGSLSSLPSKLLCFDTCI